MNGRSWLALIAAPSAAAVFYAFAVLRSLPGTLPVEQPSFAGLFATFLIFALVFCVLLLVPLGIGLRRMTHTRTLLILVGLVCWFAATLTLLVLIGNSVIAAIHTAAVMLWPGAVLVIIFGVLWNGRKAA